MSMALSHDALAEDLAAHLAGYSVPMAVWTDMQLGPSGSARPDVYAIEKTYTALRARVFEVKVSRADFLSDVTSGKYLRYAAFAGSITFATPAGLVSKDEVPKGCGLITRSTEGVWRYQRKPTLQPTPDLSRDAWLKLVIDGCGREREIARAAKCGPRTSGEWQNQDRMRKRAGAELGSALANRDGALRKLNAETDSCNRTMKERRDKELADMREERERLESVRTEAATALGLERDTSWWSIRRELDERLKGEPAKRITSAMQSVDRAIDSLSRQREELARMAPAESGVPA